MKFLDFYNIKISVSNEEKYLFKKIKKSGEIASELLNEREKFLVRQLLNKNLINYKIKDDSIIYYISI